MRPDVRVRFMRELSVIRRTGEHPDGRPLGVTLAPALDRIIAFLERDPTAAPCAGKSGPRPDRVSP